MSPGALRWQRPGGTRLAFFAFVLIGAHDGALGVLLPSLQAHYGVDKSTISLLFLVGNAGYLVAAFTSGLLSEKLGVRLFLVLGGVMFLAGALPFALMLPFAVVLTCLLLLDFGVAIIDAGLNSYIAGLPENAAPLNYLHAFYGVGALLGPLVASFALAASLGWNSVYVVWVAMGLLLLVGFFALFRGRPELGERVRSGMNWAHAREAGTRKPEPAPHRNESLGEDGNLLFAALKRREVWFGALFLLLYVGGEVSLGSWAYSFLTGERHEAQLVSGLVVSGYWMGLTLGRFLLARVAGRVGSRRMIEGCLAGVVLGVLLVWLGVGPLAAGGLWLTGFSLGPIYPTTIALMSGLVPGRLLPSTVGVLASAGSIGAALFAWQAGTLAQAVGLWTLMPFEIALTVAMLGAWAALVSRRPS